MGLIVLATVAPCGVYFALFVMDGKVLNVGGSDITSDHMQGGKRNWQATCLVGPDAVFVDAVEFDESR